MSQTYGNMKETIPNPMAPATHRSPRPEREVEGITESSSLRPAKAARTDESYVSSGCPPAKDSVHRAPTEGWLDSVNAGWSPPGARRTRGPPSSPGYRGTDARHGPGRTRRSQAEPRDPLPSLEFARGRGRRSRPRPRRGP